MDYEKKYKEALGWIQSLYNGLHGKTKEEAERYFPELKESEDEKMVKFIKNQLFNIKKTITENYELDAKLTKAIDWLEKQGEEKETLCDRCKREQPSHSCQDITELGRCYIEKQGEQKPIDYNEELKKCRENPLYFFDKYVKFKDLI